MGITRTVSKRWLAVLLCAALLFSTLSIFGALPKAKASGMSIAELQAKFPQGKYWNHMGSSANNPNGYTSTPCNHNNNGTTYCNYFIHNGSRWSTQCMGFAQKLGYDYTGIDPISGSGWTYIAYSSNPSGWLNAIDNLKTGDIVTYYESTSSVTTHTIFITSVDGDTVHFGECNWGNKCIIRWDRTMSKSKLRTLHNSKSSIRVCPIGAPPPDPSVDNLGCSTAYAGWYRVKNSTGANVNQYHTKTFSTRGNMVAELPCNAYVYVSKATGQGSGQLGHITYQGVERYIAMNLFEKMSGSPIGSVDSYGGDAGSVWLNGWAFDWDNCEAQLQINVYLDNTLVYQGRADGERSDVNATYSNVVGSYHGFSLRVPTNLVGKFKFDVYAINVGTGDNTCLKSDWVTIQRVADTEAPVISNVQVSNITNQGYDISCTVTDNVGVDYVKFPTWTLANGQDDLGDWGSNPLFTGNRSGNTWTYHVNVSDHNNEGGTYQTDIRAYDTSGNLGSYLEIQVGIDREGPSISNVQVSNVTNTGYDVSCTVTDPSGVDRVQFPTWTTLNGQDDLLSDWSVNSAARGTQNGDTWTFHVNIADHNNEGGDYLTHIHAYDKYGNSTSSSAGVVSIDVEPPVIRNIQVSNVTSKGYDVSCTVTDNVGVNRVVFPTWTDRNGQDDITSEWWSVDHFATRGTQYGDTWTFHVDIADHNHESGLYHTHIYAYDDAGNRECNTTDAAEVVVPEPASTVTFDANGGTAEFDSKEVEYGDVLGVLPEADRSHYVFLGWYTDPEDGDRVTDQSDVTGSVTLYAHWVPAFGAGWQLEDGVLTIENVGAMEDYAAASDAPWFRLRSQIQSVIVSEGVTSLSSYAFYGCDELEEVSLPQSLCRIGSLAFGGCTKLSSIVIPSDVLLIGDYAFVGDDALQTITFEGHAPEIGVGAFSDVTATVIYKGNDQSWTEDIRQSYLGSLTWTSSV